MEDSAAAEQLGCGQIQVDVGGTSRTGLVIRVKFRVTAGNFPVLQLQTEAAIRRHENQQKVWKYKYTI